MSRYSPSLVSWNVEPVADTPTTPDTSTGTTTQLLWISRSSAVPGGSSGLVTSRVGCEMSSESLPAEATTVTPWLCAYLIARCSAFQIACWVLSLRQLYSYGSAKYELLVTSSLRSPAHMNEQTTASGKNRPSARPALMPATFTFGATPTMPAPLDAAAIVPAVCVPWPLSSSAAAAPGSATPLVQSALSASETLARRSGWR